MDLLWPGSGFGSTLSISFRWFSRSHSWVFQWSHDVVDPEVPTIDDEDKERFRVQRDPQMERLEAELLGWILFRSPSPFFTALQILSPSLRLDEKLNKLEERWVVFVKCLKRWSAGQTADRCQSLRQNLSLTHHHLRIYKMWWCRFPLLPQQPARCEQQKCCDLFQRKRWWKEWKKEVENVKKHRKASCLSFSHFFTFLFFFLLFFLFSLLLSPFDRVHGPRFASCKGSLRILAVPCRAQHRHTAQHVRNTPNTTYTCTQLIHIRLRILFGKVLVLIGWFHHQNFALWRSVSFTNFTGSRMVDPDLGNPSSEIVMT